MVFNLFKKGSSSSKQADDKNKPSSRYFSLKVKEVVRETNDAVTVYFDPAGREINYKPGQFFTLIMNIDNQSIRRSYSLCTSPDTDEFPGVTVKRVEGGLVSNYINSEFRAGDEIELMEPMGVFTTDISHNQERNLVFFGGGSGITPLMALSKSILKLEPKTKITLLYANRDTDSIIFKSKLAELENTSDGKFKVFYVLETAPENWIGYRGRLTPGIIGDVLGKVSDQGEVTEYFMCGPEGMMMAISTAFRELGLPKEKLRKESFTAGTPEAKTIDAPVPSANTAAGAKEVKVIYDGEEYSFAVEEDKTILETALELDIDLPFSCQSGLCTACRGKCLSGKVRMDEMEGLSDSEIEEGYVLTCVGHPLTNDVIIEIG